MKQLIKDLILPFGLSMENVEILPEKNNGRADVPVIYADIGKLGGINALVGVTR
jgi:hypothetical protein